MILLVSFPRSGNTFFRNVLHDVYGLPSSTYHQEPGRELDADWASYPVIKTHLLPQDLPPELQAAKVVYLVRDGRDALVSLSHHRKDIVEPGSDYYTNLLEAMLAQRGSYFGGWSENVKAWTARADLVISFEALIQDPIGQVERLRGLIDLPPPQKEKLPTFEQLKFGVPTYGAGAGHNFDPQMPVKNFRKGKKGGWREEMPLEIQQFFWQLHGPVMQQHGYLDGALPWTDYPVRRVLIEATKLFTPDQDGVKRYLVELLEHFILLLDYLPNWEVDLIHNNEFIPLGELHEFITKQQEEDATPAFAYETNLLRFKGYLQRHLPAVLYQQLSKIYRQGPFRHILTLTRETLSATQKRKTRQLSELLHDKQYQLLHLPLPQHFDLLHQFEGPKLVTVHDLTHHLYPDFHTTENIRLAEKGMQLAQNKNAHLLAISEATQQDVLAHYDFAPTQIRVIYEGANGHFSKQEQPTQLTSYLQALGIPNKPYFATLSTVEPRKNLANVIAAFRALKAESPDQELQLLICGKRGWKSSDLYQDEEELHQAGIFFTGFVPDEQLPLLLSHAIALCYVSYYEGFGLPILEAMQCGTPVIYGNNSSMPEVAGEGGIGVDAQDAAAIKAAMYTISNNPAVRAALATLATAQAKKFSWLKAAFQTLCYYEEIINQQQE